MRMRSFDVMRGEVLRTQYGQNPWQEHNQVVTSISWISRVEDAKESLLRSQWDLVVVDEAHKMSAYSADKKTLAFQIGEALSQRTDHFLLMTATPYKGDPENFRLFLSLLDRDVCGDLKSLEEAMRRYEAQRRAAAYIRCRRSHQPGFHVRDTFVKQLDAANETVDKQEAYAQGSPTAEQFGAAAADESRRGWRITLVGGACIFAALTQRGSRHGFDRLQTCDGYRRHRGSPSCPVE